jgi:hypothetical protein
MEQAQTIAITKDRVLALTRLIVLIGIATFVPLLGQQAVVGPTVNATLFIATILLGPHNAILVGLTPSVISLSTGLLPPVLAPMVPFIMLSNTILILIFHYFWKKSYWSAVALASGVKFLFLFGTSSIVINLLLKKEVASNVSLMMSWPQLATALAGGFIAYLFLRSIKKM